MLERRLLWLVPLVFVTLAVLGVRRARDSHAAAAARARLDEAERQVDPGASGLGQERHRLGAGASDADASTPPLPPSRAASEVDAAPQLDANDRFLPDAGAVAR